MSVTDDNVQIGLGNTSGAQIATDYDGTSHYQLIKLVQGRPDTGFTYVGQGTGDDAPLPVRLFADDTGDSPLQGTNIGGSQALNVNILGAYGNTGVATLYAGTSDAVKGYPLVTVGNTSDRWNIRSLTGGTVGHSGGVTGNVDFVVVQGVSGGYEVGITWPGGVVNTTITNVLPLTGGTVGYSGGIASDVDFAVVQGVSGGWPVPSRLVGGTGGTWGRSVGVSGGAYGVETGSILSWVSNPELGVTGTVGITWPGGVVNTTITNVSALTGGTVGHSGGVTGNVDFVVVQGVSGGWPVPSQIHGMSFAGPGYSGPAPIGMSGDALKVAIASAGITVSVDVTDTNFMVEGFTGARGLTAAPISIRGYTGDDIKDSPVIIAGTEPDDRVGVTAGASFNVQSVAGSPVGITATGFLIRNLTGGTVGHTGSEYPRNRDFAVVQGVSGGYPVATSLFGASGSTSTTSVGVSGGGVGGVTGSLLSWISNTALGVTFASVQATAGAAFNIQGTVAVTGGTWGSLPVTGTDLDIRSLTGGTVGHSGGVTGNVDFAVVQGVSGGWPVPSQIHGMSFAGPAGSGPAPIGMSGDALKVSIASAGITVNVDVIDTSFLVSGRTDLGSIVPVTVRGSTAAGNTDAPVIIAGTAAGSRVGVTAGASFNVQTVTGAPIGITATDFNIRGLTYNGSDTDVVGISGPMFTKVVGISGGVDFISLGITSMAARFPASGTIPTGTNVESIATSIDTLADNVALESTLSKVEYGMSGSNGSNSSMKVYVVDTQQPPSLFNGQTTVPISDSVQISTTQPLRSGVNIKSHQQNTGLVFIGAAGVTILTGYPLSAGEEIFLEVDDAMMPHIIAETSGQTACWTAS